MHRYGKGSKLSAAGGVGLLCLRLFIPAKGASDVLAVFKEINAGGKKDKAQYPYNQRFPTNHR